MFKSQDKQDYIDKLVDTYNKAYNKTIENPDFQWNPNKLNFDRYDPGINSSPNGPVNLPYQFDLNPNKSSLKPSLEL